MAEQIHDATYTTYRQMAEQKEPPNLNSARGLRSHIHNHRIFDPHTEMAAIGWPGHVDVPLVKYFANKSRKIVIFFKIKIPSRCIWVLSKFKYVVPKHVPLIKIMNYCDRVITRAYREIISDIEISYCNQEIMRSCWNREILRSCWNREILLKPRDHAQTERSCSNREIWDPYEMYWDEYNQNFTHTYCSPYASSLLVVDEIEYSAK